MGSTNNTWARDIWRIALSRNIFGMYTDVNSMDFDMLGVSALVHLMASDNDARIIRSWKGLASPCTYWIYRSPRDQDAQVSLGWLQNEYGKCDTHEKIRRLAWDYADWHASWMKPAGLDYMFVESGPNELNPGIFSVDPAENDRQVKKAVDYSIEFIGRMRYWNLKPVVGCYSTGWPKTIKWHNVDGWAPWIPVFDALDAANYGHDEPQAAWGCHEYALDDMLLSIDRNIMYYSLMPYNGPIASVEFGWYADHYPPSTGEKIRQLKEINKRLGNDHRYMGMALWDCRDAAAKDSEKLSYMYHDMVLAIKSQIANNEVVWECITVTTSGTPDIIEVPPVTSDWISVENNHDAGTRIRKGPGLYYDQIGRIAPGETVTISQEAAQNLGNEQSWVKVFKNEELGWSAAWCLKERG